MELFRKKSLGMFQHNLAQSSLKKGLNASIDGQTLASHLLNALLESYPHFSGRAFSRI